MGLEEINLLIIYGTGTFPKIVESINNLMLKKRSYVQSFLHAGVTVDKVIKLTLSDNWIILLFSARI